MLSSLQICCEKSLVSVENIFKTFIMKASFGGFFRTQLVRHVFEKSSKLLLGFQHTIICYQLNPSDQVNQLNLLIIQLLVH